MKVRVFLLSALMILISVGSAFAEFTMPTDATTAFTDLVAAVAAFAALAWTVANASTIAKAGLRMFKSFVGKAL